jgi:hypothetical protein
MSLADIKQQVHKNHNLLFESPPNHSTLRSNKARDKTRTISMPHVVLEPEQKALEINLDAQIYGAFAEIGAGQEVAAQFFHAGAAANTISKTMSAYDKIVSDEIYGPEEKGRYVSQTRLYKMLDHEFQLMEERLREHRPDQCFFAFADTVSTINFQRTFRGHGWLGLRFQLKADSPPNDLILHVHLQDPNARLQQQAIGILGVNMIHASYRHFNDPEDLVESLMDSLDFRVEIDMVRLTGPDFQDLDNRLLSLWTVKHKLSNVAIFNPKKESVHASEFLYRKPILIARGSYRPVTLVQQDMIRNGLAQFRTDLGTEADQAFIMAEITLDNLSADGGLNEKDFLDRADVLCALGQTVIVSACVQHKSLIHYFSDYKVPQIGLLLGVKKLSRIIHETLAENPTTMLQAFGQIFLENVRFYVYPAMTNGTDLVTLETMDVPENLKTLITYLKEHRQIVAIEQYNPDYLHIHHKVTLKFIREGNPQWEAEVPAVVADQIKQNQLFGFMHPLMG